jgi:hypothetical protein
MRIFKLLFNFYINSSIHVGLSCCALVLMTQHLFYISFQQSMATFAFFGTVVGYNFVKYDALARVQKRQMRNQLKGIAVFSFCCLVLAGYFFLDFQRSTQLVSVGVLGITLLYTLSFFPNKKNARNWAGVKIYIVAMCWVGVTVVLPVLNAKIPIMLDFYLICIQRFLLIFVLILIFEIIDLKNDDVHLKTVPQQIGVKRTKQLGYLLLLLYGILSIFSFYLMGSFTIQYLILSMFFLLLIAFFLAFANERRSKYYTSFWVESIPILWWLMVSLI